MNWYILYKGKAKKDSLKENLDRVGINYFIPTSFTEYYDGGEMKVREDQVLKNLIFIQTDEKVLDVANSIDGLKHPYIDHTTNQPASVSNSEMQRFIQFVKARNVNATVLPDLYSHFRHTRKYVSRLVTSKELKDMSFAFVAIANSSSHSEKWLLPSPAFITRFLKSLKINGQKMAKD